MNYQTEGDEEQIEFQRVVMRLFVYHGTLLRVLGAGRCVLDGLVRHLGRI